MFRQYRGIIALTLNPTDGVVKQTGVHRSHYTWWRTTSFQTSSSPANSLKTCCQKLAIITMLAIWQMTQRVPPTLTNWKCQPTTASHSPHSSAEWAGEPHRCARLSARSRCCSSPPASASSVDLASGYAADGAVNRQSQCQASE